MVGPQFWQIRAHSDRVHDPGVVYATYPNLFTIKIHHNGEFSKPPKRRYKFDMLDCVDLIDSDVFSIHELDEMLEELDVDVIKLLNYTPECKEIEVYIETDVSLVEQHLVELLVHSQSKGVGNDVVIEDIIEDNVVSRRGKDSSFQNLMEDSDVEIHNVENEHENVDGVHEQAVGNIHEKVHIDGDIHKKVHGTLIDDDLFQQDSDVDWQQDHYHIIDEQQEIAEMDVDKEVVEMEENVVEEKEEGFDDGDESDLQKDDNELPHT
ncbi:hypothetical protein Tco_1209712 [Tanacetum coccineum]